MDTNPAFLLRRTTWEQIPLSKPLFRIGKEQGYVDYHVADNKVVSRCHAEIKKTEHGYTITDRQSTNRTYLNEDCLTSGKPYTLRHGDVIKLGNELFDFLDSAHLPHVPAELYRVLRQGLSQMLASIPIRDYPLPVINRTLHQILLDDPTLCHFTGAWQLDGALIPTYVLDFKQYRELSHQARQVIGQLALPPTATPEEKAAAVYRWLAANVVYDPTATHSQTAYGALVERRALCTGIAKAYQLLLQSLDIPCCLVEGSLDDIMKHVWNRYRVGSTWYHADVVMAYPQFASIAQQTSENFTQVTPYQILRTHIIWHSGEKPMELSPIFFQSLQSRPNRPHQPLNQIPASLRHRLLGAPQYVASGSVSDVYRFGPAVLKRIPCGEDPAKLYHAMQEYAMLQKVSSCAQVAKAQAWELTREADGYVLYLVLEYGQPLDEYCSRVPITPLEAVTLVRSACQALIQCYAAGVAHLDVQPGNLLVFPNSTVKLTDFSSAVPTGQVPQLTDLRGTPAYMAPEVCSRRAYSQAADVYSLGLLLYSLLSGGKLPYSDQYPPHEATQQRMMGLPIRLEAAVAAEVKTLVAKACSYLPAERYPSLTHFSQALDSLLGVLREQNSRIFSVPESFNYTPGNAGGPVYHPSDRPAPMPPAPRPAPMPSAPMPAAPAPAPQKTAKKGGFWPFSGSKKEPARPIPGPQFTPPAPAPSFTPPAPAPSFAPPAPAPSFAPPAPAPIFHADTFGASTVLAAPTPISPNNYGETLAPEPPSFQPAPAPARVDKVQFSAIAPQKALKGEYTLVQLFMYEPAFRSAVDEALQMADGPMQEKKTGFYQVRDNTRVKVVLSSPDVEIFDDTSQQVWTGSYLCFDFALDIPQDTPKRQLLLKAVVYFDDIPATRLMMTLRLQTQHEQRMEVLRSDVLSAFVSYASQDRSRVGGLIQGMKKARPDMDIFFDVNSLRSGDDWERTLRQEVERRDILFLCWSQHAKQSPWVDMEWRYALENKGLEAIEPIPIDPPELCPPPQELQSKHFNDSLLYIINRP